MKNLSYEQPSPSSIEELVEDSNDKMIAEEKWLVAEEKWLQKRKEEIHKKMVEEKDKNEADCLAAKKYIDALKVKALETKEKYENSVKRAKDEEQRKDEANRMAKEIAQNMANFKKQCVEDKVNANTKLASLKSKENKSIKEIKKKMEEAIKRAAEANRKKEEIAEKKAIFQKQCDENKANATTQLAKLKSEADKAKTKYEEKQKIVLAIMKQQENIYTEQVQSAKYTKRIAEHNAKVAASQKEYEENLTEIRNKSISNMKAKFESICKANAAEKERSDEKYSTQQPGHIQTCPDYSDEDMKKKEEVLKKIFTKKQQQHLLSTG